MAVGLQGRQLQPGMIGYQDNAGQPGSPSVTTNASVTSAPDTSNQDQGSASSDFFGGNPGQLPTLVNPGTPIPPAGPTPGTGSAANPAMQGLMGASPSATAFEGGYDESGGRQLATGPTALRQGIGTRQGTGGASLAMAGLQRIY